MRRIAHITTVHSPYDQRIFHRECISLNKAGYDVSLLAYGDISGYCKGIKLISLGRGEQRKAGLSLSSRWKRTQKAYKLALELNADIYHFHDTELIGTGIALKKRFGARVIYDCHEDNVAYMLQKKYIPFPLRKLMANVIRYQEWNAARKLDAIVTADEGMENHFKRQGAAYTIRANNYPRLDLFVGKAEDIIPEYDLVYHGTIPKYHLITCFAVDSELVKRGLNPTWLFIGKCSDLEWAKEQIRDKKATDRFTFKGFMPHENIARFVRQGHIGIIPLPNYPKFQRNLPTKLFEFMALKMPVVLSDLPPSRPFVGDGKCAIMVNPDSPLEYADAIADLMTDSQRCKEMGEEGYRRVVANYNWEVSSVKILSLYEKLLCTN